ncbi:TerD family protein [Streptomyces polyrhachis]|uniref:TerD family protein n=1 Tax=Streptomyces polyrhachis TaxID=1282885 RepID=A0ABW2GM77_9ACTN
MTHAMAKGANLTLRAAAVRAVLRWHPGPAVPDVDASVLLLGADGRVRSDDDFVFYNQPRHPSGTVRKLPKQSRTDGLTDSIEVRLESQAADVGRLVLAASSDQGTFDQVSDLRVLLYDAGAPGAEPFAYFDITPETGRETALICGEFYRREGGWRFRALGQGYDSGLVGLATDFGISVDEEAAAAAQEPPAPQPAPQPVPQSAQPHPAPPQQPPPPPSHPAPAPVGYGYPPAFTLPPQGPQFIGR